MATGPENTRVTPPHDPDERYQATEYDAAQEGDDHPLEGPQAQSKLSQLQEWYQQAREGQYENRQQQEIDADFYDGLQWTQEDIDTLQARGQPAFVFNNIKPAVDWVIGTERKTRADFKVFPRKDEDREIAQIKGKLLKYVNDVNNGEYARSRAFKDAARVGVGWLEDGVRDDITKDPIFSGYESWRNIYYDPLSREKDLSDARYLFRVKWVDKDIALRMFPDREEAIKRSARGVSELFRSAEGQEPDDDFIRVMAEHHEQELTGTVGSAAVLDGETINPGNERDRVRLVECWYKEPAKVQIMRGYNEALEGQEFDPQNTEHMRAESEGEVSLRETLRLKMRVAIFTGDALLADQETPYKHNSFPFTPIWGWRRDRDNAPYGMIRNSRDPQEDLNKRASKALHILSSNQVVADKSAVDDWNEAVEQIGRSDGVIRVNGERRFEFVSDKALASEHLQLMQQDQVFIQNTTGVTDENMGRETNATSGKAIQARQEQGQAVTFELFDNLRLAMQIQGEKQLSLVEQYYDMPRKLRIVGQKGQSEFIEINQPRYDENGAVTFDNDITGTQADFVVDQQDFNQTTRQAMFEQLMELSSKLPADITLQMLDLVIDLSDVPNKDELVSRIRKLNGQLGPDEDQDPELKQQQQAKQAEQERDQEIERQDTLSEVQERLAKATNERLGAQKEATELAKELRDNPDLARIVDQLLGSAGYEESRNDLYATLMGRAPPEPNPEPKDHQDQAAVQRGQAALQQAQQPGQPGQPGQPAGDQGAPLGQPEPEEAVPRREPPQ
ncbi:MAG: portal protein [Thiohalorhabdus sp.]|uniref:portal protein n=1 Tax=Thiohalorhabdus sp. TaxID=3094134 RepID=UPI002FC2CF23